MADLIYDVFTNADPEEISEIGLEIYRQWVSFATGGNQINGKVIKNPGGRYARSIRLEQESLNHVAIIADPKIAPEAYYLEVGHPEIDLKKYLTPGKVYPLHYGGGFAAGQAIGGGRSGRGQILIGFARFNPNSTGWILPAMPAYETGLTLAKMAAKMAGGGEISW